MTEQHADLDLLVRIAPQLPKNCTLPQLAARRRKIDPPTDEQRREALRQRVLAKRSHDTQATA